LERNWRQWKGKQSGERRMKMIVKKEESEKEKLGVRKWTEDDDNEMGNMVDPYYKL